MGRHDIGEYVERRDTNVVIDGRHLKSWSDPSNYRVTRARRLVLTGFPVAAYAMTRTEVSSYFEAARIQCLLCGKLYATLDRHLRCIHDLTPDDYRQRYGLPYGRGLDGASYHVRRSEIGTELRASGKLLNLTDHPDLLEKARQAPRRTLPDFCRAENQAQLRRMTKKNTGKTRFTQEDYDLVAYRINELGWTRKEAIRGVMSWPSWEKYVKDNPQLQLRPCSNDSKAESAFLEVGRRIMEDGVSQEDALHGVMGNPVWYRYLRENPAFAAPIKAAIKERKRLRALENCRRINAKPEAEESAR